MKKLAFLILVLLTSNIKAQDYSTGIGIRLGGITSGITVKHFVNSNSAIEGIASFGRHAFLITGLYEKHQSFPNAEGLSWFYGGGGHVGFFGDGYTYGHYRYYKYKGNKVIIEDDNYYRSNIFIGADFILGLEYKFQSAPITLGLDLKPAVDIVPGFYGYFEGAFTFRFTL